MKRVTTVGLMLAVLGSWVSAQEPKLGELGDPGGLGDAVIDHYLARETARLSDRFLDGAATREEWESRRPKLKEQYLEMLGLWPLPERTPLKATVTGTLERDDFRVEKLHFQSKPGLYVTANLYLPKKSEGKLPGVLYVCGHANKGRDGNKTGYQRHPIWFATNGYVCLVVDTLQLGEIAGTHHGTYGIRRNTSPPNPPLRSGEGGKGGVVNPPLRSGEGGKGGEVAAETRWWWQAAGYTPAGVECWNGMRAIDYLQSRPEVDPERIAVTGRSGGGAATFWIAAADERVKVAVPVSGMSDLETYVADKVINGHCDCMFLINTYAWEWTTIAALVAPRPLLFLNSGHDRIFPMPGNERIRDRLERLYRLYTPKPETLFDVGVTPGGHQDNLALRLMAYRWINVHLKKETGEVHEPEVPLFDGKELRVFPEDKDLPSDALNARIDETFVPRAQIRLPENAATFGEWRRDKIEQLRTRTFRDWPEQVPAATVLKGTTEGRLMETEAGIAVRTFIVAGPEKPQRSCILVLNPEEPENQAPAWAAQLVGKRDAVVLLSPRGCGGLAWTRKSPPNTVERAHALLGTTVDTGRVRDIQALARMLHETDENNTPIVVAGKGQAGVLAAYAAILEPSINEVVAVEPPASHKEGPIFLNVLRVLDVPEAFGLLAPKTLTLVDARDRAFERTGKIFAAAGAAGNFKRQ